MVNFFWFWGAASGLGVLVQVSWVLGVVVGPPSLGERPPPSFGGVLRSSCSFSPKLFKLIYLRSIISPFSNRIKSCFRCFWRCRKQKTMKNKCARVSPLSKRIKRCIRRFWVCRKQKNMNNKSREFPPSQTGLKAASDAFGYAENRKP